MINTEYFTHFSFGLLSPRSQPEMEPEVKRLKTDNKSTENGLVDEKSNISYEFADSEWNTADERAERAPDAGKGQLPVCQHGLECNDIDLIHFAEFWHPTERKLEADENNNEKDEKHEEEECEVVELPNYYVDCTQPVFDEEYSDSEAENGEDDKFFASKSHEEHLGSDSLGSQ